MPIPVIPTVVEELDESEERLLDPPMVVHCSAGVGRTGVLILAECALELLARGQPLYPLEMLRAARAQRPMCIQNAVSKLVGRDRGGSGNFAGGGSGNLVGRD